MDCICQTNHYMWFVKFCFRTIIVWIHVPLIENTQKCVTEICRLQNFFLILHITTCSTVIVRWLQNHKCGNLGQQNIQVFFVLINDFDRRMESYM